MVESEAPVIKPEVISRERIHGSLPAVETEEDAGQRESTMQSCEGLSCNGLVLFESCGM